MSREARLIISFVQTGSTSSVDAAHHAIAHGGSGSLGFWPVPWDSALSSGIPSVPWGSLRQGGIKNPHGPKLPRQFVLINICTQTHTRDSE